MSILSLLKSRPQSLAADYPNDQLVSWVQSAGTPSAMRVSTYYACVNVLSQDVAKLPLILYRRTADGGRERATDHPMYKLMHDRPNSWQTSYLFRQWAQAHIGVNGNAYALKTRVAGRVKELLPIHPDRVQVKQDDNWSLIYRIDGKPYSANDILHVRGLSLDGITGVSVATHARQTLELTHALETHGTTLFSNGALPRGILTHPGKLKDDVVAKRMRESFDAAFGGVGNAHRTALLEDGVKYDKLSMSPEDSQFLASREFQAYEIARWFRMPPHKVGLLKNATFCLPAGELVFAESGPIPIEDITPGTLVWSRGDDGLVLSPVKHAIKTGSDPILTIQTTNRTIRCNTKHPILVRRKTYEPLEPGQIGGANINGEKMRVRWITEYVPAGELVEGDTIVTLAHLPDDGDLTACPTRTPTIEFMEFCGLLLGDGSVMRTGTGQCVVSVARGADAPYMDHYRKVIQSEFVSYVCGSTTRTRPAMPRECERQTRFGSVLAVEELETLGLNGNSHTKQVPAWVFRMPEQHRLAFLRGYLDSDGSVDNKGRISYSSVSETMLRQVWHLCVSCGIPVTNVRNQIGTTILPDGREVEYSAWEFTCSDPGANRRIGSHTPQHRDRLDAGKPFGKKNRNYPRHGGKDFDEEGLSLARICSITIGPEEDVYDLEVADTHSFIASGVVVHNSNIEHQALEYVQDTLLSWLINWEQELNRSLLTPAEQDDYYFEHLVDGLLRGDQASRYKAYKDAVLTGFMTRNEVRAKENMNPADGLDEFLIPLNMTSPENFNNEPADG